MLSNAIGGEEKFIDETLDYDPVKFKVMTHKQVLQESINRIYFMQNNMGDKDNSVTNNLQKIINKSAQLVKANEIIKKLENGGKGGLMHLGALSNVTGLPIMIFDSNGGILGVIGKKYCENIIKLQYTQNLDGTGHWIVPGIPHITQFIKGNNCLFAAVAAQCNMTDPNALRIATVINMRANINYLAFQIPDMERIEKYEKISLLEGGVYSLITDSIDKTRIGKFSGRANIKQVLVIYDGNRIVDGAAPAHSIASHVGKIENKSTFENKEQMTSKLYELKALIKINSSNIVYKSVREMPRKKGKRELIIGKVSTFKGYDNKQKCKFRYVLSIRDTPHGQHDAAPQTTYPLTDEGLTKFLANEEKNKPKKSKKLNLHDSNN